MRVTQELFLEVFKNSVCNLLLISFIVGFVFTAFGLMMSTFLEIQEDSHQTESTLIINEQKNKETEK